VERSQKSQSTVTPVAFDLKPTTRPTEDMLWMVAQQLREDGVRHAFSPNNDPTDELLDRELPADFWTSSAYLP
jgi:hypothetical protein